jgi:hypothetical protein
VPVTGSVLDLCCICVEPLPTQHGVTGLQVMLGQRMNNLNPVRRFVPALQLLVGREETLLAIRRRSYVVRRLITSRIPLRRPVPRS